MGRDPICRRCDLPLSRHSRGFPDLCPIIATFAPVPAPAGDAAAEVERLIDDAMCFVETYGLKHEIAKVARAKLLAFVSGRPPQQERQNDG